MKLRHTIALAIIALQALSMQAQNGAWVVYDTRNSDIGGNNIAAIAPDQKGVWVGTYQGLSRLSGPSWLDYSMFNSRR